MISNARSAVRGTPRLRRALFEELWFQALCGIGFSTVAPCLVLLAIWPNEVIWSASVQNTIVAGFAAFVSGMLWHRRLVRHPGARGLENVLTTFVTTFGAAASFLLLARFEYSRVYLFISFATTLVGFALLATRVSITEHPHFYVVPFGNFDRLLGLTNGSWTIMRKSTIPRGATNGLVVDLRADIPDAWQSMIADAVLAGTPVFHLKQIEEALSGRVDIEHMSENHLGSLLPNLGYRKMKSITDAIIAVILLPIMLVPFFIIAILIKIDSPGPIFYRQPRVGIGGRTFSMVKFRSMHIRDEDADPRAAAMTVCEDSRVTRLGRVMRHYRIDEWPQIFNVLTGEMSWIGPRPEVIELSHWYLAELPFYQYRHIVKPGLTGWAQVNQGHVTDLSAVRDKLRYDFYYIKYYSIWLDIVIAIRTARIVVGGFGAK